MIKEHKKRIKNKDQRINKEDFAGVTEAKFHSLFYGLYSLSCLLLTFFVYFTLLLILIFPYDFLAAVVADLNSAGI